MTRAEADLSLLSSCPPCWHRQISLLELDPEGWSRKLRWREGSGSCVVLCAPGDAQRPPGTCFGWEVPRGWTGSRGILGWLGPAPRFREQGCWGGLGPVLSLGSSRAEPSSLGIYWSRALGSDPALHSSSSWALGWEVLEDWAAVPSPAQPIHHSLLPFQGKAAPKCCF